MDQARHQTRQAPGRVETAAPKWDRSRTEVGPKLVHICDKDGPKLAKAGPEPDRNRTETGPKLTETGPKCSHLGVLKQPPQSGTEAGPKPDRNRTEAGPKPDRS